MRLAVFEKLDQRMIWNKRYSGNMNRPESDRWIELFMEYLKEKQGYTLVDLGCGRGNYSLYLHKQGYNIIACDFSPAAIAFINQENPLIETRCLDMISEFPDDIRNVGVVLASLSTHYFLSDDTIKLYGNIRAMLDMGGYFIFRVNSMKELENKDQSNVSKMIERDYYLLNDGSTKRYFDLDSISSLLKDFSILKLNEDSEEYHGSKKYYIEGLAQKI